MQTRKAKAKTKEQEPPSVMTDKIVTTFLTKVGDLDSSFVHSGEIHFFFFFSARTKCFEDGRSREKVGDDYTAAAIRAEYKRKAGFFDTFLLNQTDCETSFRFLRKVWRWLRQRS